MLTKPFTNNLKAHRKKVGLIQTEVASRLQLDCVNRISRWEKGSSVPSVINLFKLAALYGVPPHELYLEIYRSVQQDVTRSQPSTMIDDPFQSQASHETFPTRPN